MNATSTRRRPRTSLLIVTVVWAALALYLGLASRLPIVGDVDASTWAKWGHVVAAMFLAALIYLLVFDTGRTRRDAVIAALVVTITAGALLEVLQAIAGTRDPTVVDVLYDTLGAVIAVALLSLPLLSTEAWTRVVTLAVVVMAVVVVPAAVFATPDDETPSCAAQTIPVESAADTNADGSGAAATPIARYDFEEGTGTTVADLSGVDPALDLRLSGSQVEWIDGGGLRFDGGIAESAAARRITEAAEESGEITVEAWVRTADLDQTGPTRIVSISDGTQYHEVNVHLGQDGRNLSVRLRATCGDFTATTTPNVFDSTKAVVHLAATFADGVERVYVDGENVAAWRFDGRLGTWDPAFPLVVGNEATLDRPFDGDVLGVAIYDAALPGSVLAAHVEQAPAR